MPPRRVWRVVVASARTIAKLEGSGVYLLQVGVGDYGPKVRILDAQRRRLGPVMWLGSVLAHVHGTFVAASAPVAAELLRDVADRNDHDLTAKRPLARGSNWLLRGRV